MPNTKPHILLIDDEPEFTSFLCEMLGIRYDFTVAHDTASGIHALETTRPDVVLLDLSFTEDGLEGFDLLRHAVETDDKLPVIMLTGITDLGEVVRAIKLGAYHYVTKPPDLTELSNLIDHCVAAQIDRRRVAALELEIARLRGVDGLDKPLLARDPVTLAVLDEVRKVAPTEATVLITGPSGAGKEMLASFLHQVSPRRKRPFIAVNCTTIDNDRIESELFGHVEGAFTGATKDVPGRFEIAHGGVLFLDEIGEISPKMQVKLLRVIETHTFERVGETKTRRVDVRIVAATNKNLAEEIAGGRFREDLYHRLCEFPVHLPALRRRRGDIEPLAEHFLSRFAREYRKTISGFSPAARRFLHEHEWRGNVRELRNAVQRAVILCEGEQIQISHLMPAPTDWVTSDRPLAEIRHDQLRAIESQYVKAQLRRHGGHLTRAAAASGLTPSALSKLCKKLGIVPEEFRSP